MFMIGKVFTTSIVKAAQIIFFYAIFTGRKSEQEDFIKITLCCLVDSHRSFVASGEHSVNKLNEFYF